MTFKLGPLSVKLPKSVSWSLAALVAAGLVFVGLEARSAIDSWGEPTSSLKGARVLDWTAAWRKAGKGLEECVDTETGRKAPLVVERPTPKSQAKAEKKYRIDVDGDGRIAGKEPAPAIDSRAGRAIEGWLRWFKRKSKNDDETKPKDDETTKDKETPLEPVAAVELDRLAEVTIPAHYGRRDVDFRRRRDTGEVEAFLEPPGKVEWIHEVRYRLAASIDGSRQEGSVAWTPLRTGWVYWSLEPFWRRLEPELGSTITDRGAMIGSELRCHGLFRCRPN